MDDYENMKNANGEMDTNSKQDELYTEETGNYTSEERVTCACVTSCRYTRNKLRTDASYQDKVIYSTCIFAAFFIIGWSKGQFGPAYIDLRMLSGTDIDQGSWILTSLFIGYALGSILQGILYNRLNRKFCFGACLFMWSIVTAVIPWCSRFEPMLIGYIVIGVLQGILDTGGIAEILRIWEKNGRVANISLNFVFAFGSVLAPLAVAPFLMEPHKDNALDNTTSSDLHQNKMASNTSFSNHGIYIQWNNTGDYNFTRTKQNISVDRVIESAEFKSESRIYIPFSLIAGISFVASIMFLISYLMHSKNKKRQIISKGENKTARKLPVMIKQFTLLIIGAIFFFYYAIDEGYTAFLSTFCVEYFHWSKSAGAFVTSLVFIPVLVGRLLTILFDRCINTLVCIGVNMVLMLLSVLGLLLASLYRVSTAVWVFAPLFGFSKANLFPLLFCWSNEYIVPMSGRLSACYFVSATVGSAINPLLLGHLMARDLIWYCYLFLIEITMVLVLFLIGVAATKYIVRNHGYPFDIDSNVAKTDNSENVEFIDKDSNIPAGQIS